MISLCLSLADVKPSNVLINTLGQVKMCDFGISGYLVDSVAKTMDAGCKPYMAVSAKKWEIFTAIQPITYLPDSLYMYKVDDYDILGSWAISN